MQRLYIVKSCTIVFIYQYAKELGAKAIAVNVISPGPTDTELFREGKTQEQIDRLAQMPAFGKLGEVQEIADVVAFLASDEASTARRNS